MDINRNEQVMMPSLGWYYHLFRLLYDIFSRMILDSGFAIRRQGLILKEKELHITTLYQRKQLIPEFSE